MAGWEDAPEGGWQDAPQTPASEHAARVERYRPEAERFAAVSDRLNPHGLPVGEIPLITPALRRASSALYSGLGIGEGDSFSERYANNLALEEARRDAARRQRPIAQGAADIGATLGAAALTPATGAGAAVANVVSRLPVVGRLAPVANAAVEGAIYGAPTAAVEALPGEGARDVARRAIEGGAEGAVYGAGAQAALSAATPAIVGARNFFRSPEDRAVRQLQRHASDVPGKPNTGRMSVQDFEEAAQAGRPVTAAHVEGMQDDVRRALGRLPESDQAEAVRRNIYGQHSDRIPTTRNAIDDIILRRPGQTIDADTLRRQSVDTARAANAPAYSAAYSAPQAQHIWNPWLENFVNTPEGRNAVKEAVEGLSYRQMGRSGQPITSPFDFSGDRVTLRPGETVPLEIWDRAKRALDETVNNLRKNPIGTRPTSASDIGEMRDALRGLLTNTVPEYSTALQGAGRYKRADNAFDDGFAFFNAANAARQTKDYQQLGAQLQGFRNRFTPEERVQFRLGLASFIRENPDQAARVFANNEQQTMRLYREVLGNRFDDVRNQMLVHNAQQAIQGLTGITPSLPHMNQQYAIGAAGLLSALVHGAVSPVSAGSQFAAHGTAWLANTRKQNTAKAILELANDPARHAELMERLRKQPNFRRTLQEMQPLFVRAISQQGVANEDRTARASGGRIGKNYRSKAQQLINAADRAKKRHNGTTQSILDMPDETVAKALSIADKAI